MLSPDVPWWCLQLVRELLLAGIIAAEANHGHGDSATLTNAVDEEELTVILTVIDCRFVGRGYEALAVSELDHAPVVEASEVGLDSVCRAGKATAIHGAVAGLVAAGLLMHVNLVLREEGRAAVLFVAAGEADAAEELLDDAVARIPIARATAAAPVVPEFDVAP